MSYENTLRNARQYSEERLKGLTADEAGTVRFQAKELGYSQSAKGPKVDADKLQVRSGGLLSRKDKTPAAPQEDVGILTKMYFNQFADNVSLQDLMKKMNDEGTLGQETSVTKAGDPEFGTSTISVDKGNTTAIGIMDDLINEFGYSPEAAAGMAGNLYHETMGFNYLKEIDPIVKGSRGGIGWAHWTGPRADEFEAYAEEKGLDINSDEANWGFLKLELSQNPRGIQDALSNVTDAKKAAEISSKLFFRPGTPRMESRKTAASNLLDRYNEDKSMGDN